MRITLSAQEGKAFCKLIGTLTNQSAKTKLPTMDASEVGIAKLNAIKHLIVSVHEDSSVTICADDPAVTAIINYFGFVATVTGADCVAAANAIQNIIDNMPVVQDFFQNRTLPNLQ